MDIIRKLNKYQKSILILLFFIILLFSIVYPIIISRVGFEYRDVILIPKQENTNIIYSGKLYGEVVQFTMFSDNSIEFQHGDKTYGTYTLKKDSTAIPKNEEFAKNMTGIELLRNDESLFRGGIIKHNGRILLYNEDGHMANIGVSINGFEIDENGKKIDSVEPTPLDIIKLTDGTYMTHKGDLSALALGVFLCIVAVISILFADELFRLRLIFRVENVDNVEPSDWEIAGRYIGWTLMPIFAIIIFVMGLQ